jgi:hypothetical protein
MWNGKWKWKRSSASALLLHAKSSAPDVGFIRCRAPDMTVSAPVHRMWELPHPVVRIVVTVTSVFVFYFSSVQLYTRTPSYSYVFVSRYESFKYTVQLILCDFYHHVIAP